MNVLDRLRAILETVTAPEDDALDGLLARLDAEELDRLEAAAHQGPDAFDAVVGELIADEVLLRPHAPPHDLERERMVDAEREWERGVPYPGANCADCGFGHLYIDVNAPCIQCGGPVGFMAFQRAQEGL